MFSNDLSIDLGTANTLIYVRGPVSYTHLDVYKRQSFKDAKSSGILDGTYRGENFDEYWAEGVQDWYDTNAQADPPDGISNGVGTRMELKEFDPRLYAMIGEVFPQGTDWGNCHAHDPR